MRSSKTLAGLAVLVSLLLGGCSFVAHDLPPEPKQYRYTMKQVRGSTTVDSTWTFTSKRITVDDQSSPFVCVLTYAGQGVPCKPESVIFMRYDLNVALDNTVAGGRDHKVTVTPFYQDLTDPPKVSSLTVSVTFDGGKKWRKVPARPGTGGSYTATIPLPSSGLGGLRVQAKDSTGATVDQTIDKALKIR